MSDLGNPTTPITQNVDDNCAPLDNSAYIEIQTFLIGILRKVDCALQLDLVFPVDVDAIIWCERYYSLRYELENLDLTHFFPENAHGLMLCYIDQIRELCDESTNIDLCVDDDEEYLELNLDEIHNDIANCLLNLSATLPYEEDLTEEGVEPNPGPVRYEDPPARYNRYRADDNLQQKQKRAMANELKAINRILAKAKRDRIKTATLYEDVAQIGATLLDEHPVDATRCEAPPPRCDRCGNRPCDCVTKKLTLAATTMSIVQSVFKVIDIISHWATVNHAQMGLATWLLGAQPTLTKADQLIDQASEHLQNLPTTDAIRTLIQEQIKNILDSDCGFLPIPVRTILLSLLTVAGLFTLYKMGILAYDLVTLPIFFILESLNNGFLLKRAFGSFMEDHKDNAHFDEAQIGLDNFVSHIPTALALSLIHI